MSSARHSAFERKHLWMYLQALSLDPSWVNRVGGKMVVFRRLGENMFDTMNCDAFHIVSYFLFQKLDEPHAKEAFRYCWPPFDQKRDREFRKHCCEWLKEISAECGSSFPLVVGSYFLFPGGPKFIHLMYQFARCVAINYIKTKSNTHGDVFCDLVFHGDSLHLAETFNVKPQDVHKCIARSHVARNRFVQILQKENYVTQEYLENAHLCIKQIQYWRSECVVLQNQVKRVEPSDAQSNIQEKIQKVRSLWTSVNELLVFLEKEREVVSSVLSLVNQCVLDGTNVAINVPRLLRDRIEEQRCQLQIGNVYEAGKLNLLTLIQLLNEVLKLLKYERCKTEPSRLTIDVHYLEQETQVQRERLSAMKHMRHKIKENITAIRHSIVEREEKWDKKWKESLGLSPFSLSKGGALAVDLLPPMSPLSFDPLSEEVYAKSVLAKYPASLPVTKIQSSWRKASETEDHRSSVPIPVDARAGEVSSESSSVLNYQRECSMAIFSPNFYQSSLPEEKAIPDEVRSMPQKHLLTSQISEPPTEDESDLMNKRMGFKQDLECATIKLSETEQLEPFSLAVGSGSEEDSVRILDHSQASYNEPSTQRTLLQGSFQTLSGVGILHEPLPEEDGHLGLNSSTSSETNFKLEPSSYVHSDPFPGEMGERQATPEPDSNFQAIISSYEALKKALNKIRKQPHLSHPNALEYEVEFSPVAKDSRADDTHTFFYTQDLLIEYEKPPPHMSLNERTQRASPLTKVSLVEQKLRTTLPCSLREFLTNLKAQEKISSKNLEARESDLTE